MEAGKGTHELETILFISRCNVVGHVEFRQAPINPLSPPSNPLVPKAPATQRPPQTERRAAGLVQNVLQQRLGSLELREEREEEEKIDRNHK